MQIIWAKLGIFQTLTISSLPTSFSLPLNSSLESGVGASGTHRNFENLGTAGYRVTGKFEKLGTAGYRVPSKFWKLGTAGYRVPSKF